MAEQASGQPESLLVEQSRQGHTSAFAQLYAAHHAVLYGYLRARLLDGNDADDLCQEVFLRAYHGLHRFQAGAPVRPWLLGIGRNVLREHLRKHRRRNEVPWTQLCLELEEMVAPGHPYEEFVHLIPACLEHLGEAAHQAINWHYMGSQKLEQIAGRLERTVGAVKVLLVRARQSLKRCLQSRMGGDGP